LPRRAAPGEPIAATVASRALRSDERDLVWFAHLVDAAERVWARRDVRGVVASGWRDGDLNVVRLELSVPPDAPPGAYRVAAGLYDRATLARFPVGRADRLLLGPLWVAQGGIAVASPATPIGRRFGEAILFDGYTLQRDGSELLLDLRWSATAEPPRD